MTRKAVSPLCHLFPHKIFLLTTTHSCGQSLMRHVCLMALCMCESVDICECLHARVKCYSKPRLWENDCPHLSLRLFHLTGAVYSFAFSTWGYGCLMPPLNSSPTWSASVTKEWAQAKLQAVNLMLNPGLQTQKGREYKTNVIWQGATFWLT